MYQRASFSCALSAMSPVFSRNFIFARLPLPCLNGLVRLSFMLRTSWSKF